jgi:hypothetical protein
MTIFAAEQSAPSVALSVILDRLVHNAHRLDLSGESLRRTRPQKLTRLTERYR